jgi:uncharacterized repeat protein (TIGR01451 family)
MNIGLVNLRKRPLLSSRMRRLLSLGLAVLLSLLAVSAVLALFNNGGFEAGNFSSWDQSAFLNFGLLGSPPFDGGSIVRHPGGVLRSAVLGATPGCDPETGNVICYPFHGAYSARVNGDGILSNANTLVQTATVGIGDVSPLDHKIHIMFAYAPVLENPNHAPQDQPWFYVSVKNHTRGDALLFEEFIFSGQPGVPWKVYTDAGNRTFNFTDWQLKDIVPISTSISFGDQIVLEVIAADCALGGHGGWAYVDDFGSGIQGLYLNKTAPAQAYAGSNLVYTFGYWNSGGDSVSNAVVTETLPASTTFVSADPLCNAPSGGVITCPLPNPLNAGITGTFQITVAVDSTAAGSTISNGDYRIAGDGVSPLLGQLVTTTIQTAPADLTIAKSFRVQYFVVTYTVVARNLGPGSADGAVVSDTLSAYNTDISWTCTTGGAATCGSGGEGDLHDTLATFPSGGVVTYTIRATLKAFGYFDNRAEVIPPAGITDPVLANNASPVHLYQVLFPLIYRNRGY